MGIVGKPLTVGGARIKTLWENPSFSQTSTFSAQTITGQDLDGVQNYSIVFVKARVWWLASDTYCFAVTPVFADEQENNMMYLSSGSGYNGQRKCSVLTDSMSFTTGRYNGSNQDGALVPKTVYGVM